MNYKELAKESEKLFSGIESTVNRLREAITAYHVRLKSDTVSHSDIEMIMYRIKSIDEFREIYMRKIDQFNSIPIDPIKKSQIIFYIKDCDQALKNWHNTAHAVMEEKKKEISDQYFELFQNIHIKYVNSNKHLLMQLERVIKS